MPRIAKYYWDKRRQVYRTDVGGRTHYFKGIARENHVGIAQAFSDHIARLADDAKPVEPDLFDLCKAFLAADRSIKPRTHQTHKERLFKFCSYPHGQNEKSFGYRPVSSFRAGDLQAAIKAWVKLGQSPHYLAGVVRSVKAAFNWAASDDGGHLVVGDLFKGVKSPEIGRSPDRYAERPEVAAFLRFVWRRADDLPEGVRLRFARRLILMLRVALHTGARPGTLVSVWWSDFDPGRRTLTLPPDRHKTGHKTKRPLVIYLTPIIVRDLVRERDRPGRHPVSIFTHERGKGAVTRGASLEAGEPWGEFATLRDGRPSFEPDPGPLNKLIRKLRKQAVARGKELRKNKGVRYEWR